MALETPLLLAAQMHLAAAELEAAAVQVAVLAAVEGLVPRAVAESTGAAPKAATEIMALGTAAATVRPTAKTTVGARVLTPLPHIRGKMTS